MPANHQVTEQMVEKAIKSVDLAKEAFDLKHALAENTYPAADGSADIDNHALPIIETTLRNICTRFLTAALADHVVVPRHPTPKMQRAGYEALDNTGDCNCSQHDVWDAMISAASPLVSQEG